MQAQGRDGGAIAMNLVIRRVIHQGSGPWLGMTLLLAAAALLVPSPADTKPFAQKGPLGKAVNTSPDKEAWQQYEESFGIRWRSLLQHQQKGDRTKWTLLETDLRTSAKRYNQQLEEEASQPMTGTTAVVNSTFTVPCLSQYDRPGFRCFIFPERNGGCRYICVQIPK